MPFDSKLTASMAPKVMFLLFLGGVGREEEGGGRGFLEEDRQDFEGVAFEGVTEMREAKS